MTIPVFPETKVPLKDEGPDRRYRQRSVDRVGVRQGVSALGAELAVTYLNDRAKKHVEPLAKELDEPIFRIPLDVRWMPASSNRCSSASKKMRPA